MWYEQVRLGIKRLTSLGLIAVALAPATHAQYTADFQTNIISGVTSNWSGYYYVGYTNSADVLLIQDSGVLSSGTGYLGYDSSSSNNSVFVTGTNSTWSNNSDLTIGGSGSGNSLVISNGGKVVNTKGSVGTGSNSNRVTVTGPTSIWSNRSDLVIAGLAWSNALVISDGGQVFAQNCTVDKPSGATGGGGNSVLVTDTNSVLNCSGSLTLGGSGPGNSLVVSNGARLVSRPSGLFSYISGEIGSGSNSVLITGAGSAWSNAADLVVGKAGPGNNLKISNGGRVFNLAGVVGYGVGSASNSVYVAEDSFWENSSLYVGFQGASNSLVVAGGSVVAANVTVGYASSTCDNLLQLDNGSVVVTNGATNAVFEVRQGKLILNGGSLQVDRFVMTNSCAQFVRTGGTLIYGTAVLETNLDADGDGMANGWEQAYGLDPLNAADAGMDNDGDGFSNLQEYQAGTDPTNASSAFRVLSVERTNNDVLVTWNAGGGRTNVVQAAAGDGGLYTNSYSNVSPNILLLGTGDVTTNYLDPGAATNASSQFYRIRLVP